MLESWTLLSEIAFSSTAKLIVSTIDVWMSVCVSSDVFQSLLLLQFSLILMKLGTNDLLYVPICKKWNIFLKF